MVSGIDRAAEAVAAGANLFLNYDEWLRIGTVVAELLAGAQAEIVTGDSAPARLGQKRSGKPTFPRR